VVYERIWGGNKKLGEAIARERTTRRKRAIVDDMIGGSPAW